jgi:hypothetical protein
VPPRGNDISRPNLLAKPILLARYIQAMKATSDIAKLCRMPGISESEFAERCGCRLSVNQAKYVNQAARPVEPVTVWSDYTPSSARPTPACQPIELNYLADPEDMRRMIDDGMRLAWRVMHQPALAAGWQGSLVSATGQLLDEATVASGSCAHGFHSQQLQHLVSSGGHTEDGGPQTKTSGG